MWDIDLSTLYDTANTIKAYQSMSKIELYRVCNDIAIALKLWTGKTWVGIKKTPEVETAFQDFFIAFIKFISNCANSTNRLEHNLADNTIYQGIVYRYIGAKERDCSAPDIIYNNIYVSWSKEPYSDYIFNHIHTETTWIKCKIDAPMFGIDIEGFENWCKKHFDKKISISKGTEREIVFPTLKECTLDIVKPFKCNRWAENGYSCECCRNELEYSEFLECSGLDR